MAREARAEAPRVGVTDAPARRVLRRGSRHRRTEPVSARVCGSRRHASDHAQRQLMPHADADREVSPLFLISN